jgi:hypothetical protein
MPYFTAVSHSLIPPSAYHMIERQGSKEHLGQRVGTENLRRHPTKTSVSKFKLLLQYSQKIYYRRLNAAHPPKMLASL